MSVVNLKIEYRKTAELIPYARNARTHSEQQISQIAASIKEFGFNNPVAIDAGGGILCGHGRVMAAQKLKLDTVPTVCLSHLTEAQKKAYILADNKLALNAGWDNDLLKVELEDLKLSGIDLELTGFSDEELKDILVEDPTEVQEDNFDGEPPEVAKSQLGDIWAMGEHRLMCGDSTSEKDVNCLMLDDKVDLVLTDPPYGITVVNTDGKVGANNFGVAKKGTYRPIIADDTVDTAQKAVEILSKLCNRLIVWGGNYFLSFLPPSSGWLVWDKRCDSGIRNSFADAELAYCSFSTPVRVYHQLWNGMIREGEHDERIHPTQKPTKILGEILKDFSSENNIIMDLFGGSGSTLIACEQLNRKCLMMELDPKYVDVIVDRWQKLTGKEAVRESDGIKFNSLK